MRPHSAALALAAVAVCAVALFVPSVSAQTPTGVVRPKNQTLGFCIWEDKKAYIYNVVPSVGCIQRSDTYETATLTNGEVTLNNVGKLDYVECYAAVDSQNTFSCSGYIGVIPCTLRNGQPVPSMAAPNRTDLPPPVPTTRPINRTLGFCEWGYGVISVRNLKPEIACIQRTDTFDIGVPTNGSFVFQNAPRKIDYVEVYGAINTESIRSCANYIGVVTCDPVGAPVVPVPSTTLPPPAPSSNNYYATPTPSAPTQATSNGGSQQQTSRAPSQSSQGGQPHSATTGAPRPPASTLGANAQPTNTDPIFAFNSASGVGSSVAAVVAAVLVAVAALA